MLYEVITKQVLVQRTPDANSGTDTLIRDLSDLKLKTLYVQKGSSNLKSLNNLASELIQNFYVVEIDSVITSYSIHYTKLYDFLCFRAFVAI